MLSRRDVVMGAVVAGAGLQAGSGTAARAEPAKSDTGKGITIVFQIIQELSLGSLKLNEIQGLSGERLFAPVCIM